MSLEYSISMALILLRSRKLCYEFSSLTGIKEHGHDECFHQSNLGCAITDLISGSESLSDMVLTRFFCCILPLFPISPGSFPIFDDAICVSSN